MSSMTARGCQGRTGERGALDGELDGKPRGVACDLERAPYSWPIHPFLNYKHCGMLNL